MSATPPLRLYICVTCDRYAHTAERRRLGRAFADAAEAFARDRGLDRPIRAVECLMGCPTPCNATLRAAGKAMLRFSGLEPDDVPALFDVASGYASSTDGDIAQDGMPPACARSSR